MGYVSQLELASTLQIRTSANRVHLPPLSKFSKAIRDEARNFELKITDVGNLTFGAEEPKKMTSSGLTYILWYGERRDGVDRPRVQWI